MKYIAEARELRGSDESVLKTLQCPLNKTWDQLQILDSVDPDSGELIDLKRHCASCRRDVINISDFDEAQVIALLKVDPGACVYASRQSRRIKFIGPQGPSSRACCDSNGDVPLIKTARTVSAINEGAKKGYWPLIKPIEPSDEIRQKIMVFQQEDGSIETAGDYRAGFSESVFWFNPYRSPLPFAAYLVPKGLDKGRRVYIPDLIEDFIGEFWNQGDSYRCESAYAVWNGDDLEIERPEPTGFVG